jgi:hypothetical protein
MVWIASHPGDLRQLGAKQGDRFLLCKRREAGIAGMIVAGRERRDPERHDSVADIFVDEAVMRMNNVGDRSEIAVQQIDDGAGG